MGVHWCIPKCDDAAVIAGVKASSLSDLKNAYMFMGEIYVPEELCENLHGAFANGNCVIDLSKTPNELDNLNGIESRKQLCELFGSFWDDHCTLPLQSQFGDSAITNSPEVKTAACEQLGGTWQDNKCISAGEVTLSRRDDVSKIHGPADDAAQVGHGYGAIVTYSPDCIQLLGGLVVFLFLAFGVKLVVEKIFKKREQPRVILVAAGEPGYSDKDGMVERV